ARRARADEARVARSRAGLRPRVGGGRRATGSVFVVRALAVGLLVAPVLASTAGARTLSTPTRAQLKLMPLPAAAYGAMLENLRRHPAAARGSHDGPPARPLDPRPDAATLPKLTRATGVARRFQ